MLVQFNNFFSKLPQETKGRRVSTCSCKDRLSLHPKAHFHHQHWQIGLRANNVAAAIRGEDAPA